MTDETTVSTANPMEMTVTTNSAPDVQRTPEMATTDPKTPIEPIASEVEPAPTEKPSEPSIEEKTNASARQAIEDRIRADNAERQLKDLQPKPKELSERPKIGDFDTLEAFEQSLIDWAEGSGAKKAQDAQTQAEQQRQQMATRTAVAVKEQESRAKHSDFDQVVSPIVPVVAAIPLLKDFLAKNPMGAEVIYELGKNPAMLEQIMRADSWTASEQLLNMAARLKKPAVVTVSNAPEPIKPVGSRETVKPKLAELAHKDINGYIALRNKQELAKRRAN